MPVKRRVGIRIPPMLPVRSSNVKRIGYDQINKVLYIEFKNNSLYRYLDVDKNDYRPFMTAPSKGKFVWSRIREIFDYERIR